MVSTSDCHPRGSGFDSRLYSRNFSGSIGSGTVSTQPREDNWIATWMRSSENLLTELKLRLRDKRSAHQMAPELPSGSNRFLRSWLFGAVAPPSLFCFILFYGLTKNLSRNIWNSIKSLMGYLDWTSSYSTLFQVMSRPRIEIFRSRPRTAARKQVNCIVVYIYLRSVGLSAEMGKWFRTVIRLR